MLIYSASVRKADGNDELSILVFLKQLFDIFISKFWCEIQYQWINY
jgi:hypothetical protein